MMALLASILTLVGEALKGQRSEEEVAKALIDHAFESGVPSAVLSKHLTAKAAQDVELAADIAQWAKVHGPKL